jgi:hypothetical protein
VVAHLSDFQRFGGVAALAGALLAGCGQKEAEDPRKILGDWMQHEGADGRHGTGGEGAPGAKGAERKLASQTQCQAAARRIEELALELAVRDADESERAELEKRRAEEIHSQGFEARVQRATEECLGRETTDIEATCVAKARSEMDIDRCSSR